MAIPRAVASTLLCRNVVVQRIAASRPVGIDDSRKVSACMGLSLVKRYSSSDPFNISRAEGGARLGARERRATTLYSVLCHGGTEVPCCTKDEGGPFGAALQGEASNCHKLLWTQVRSGERYGKRRGSD